MLTKAPRASACPRGNSLGFRVQERTYQATTLASGRKRGAKSLATGDFGEVLLLLDLPKSLATGDFGENMWVTGGLCRESSSPFQKRNQIEAGMLPRVARRSHQVAAETHVVQLPHLNVVACSIESELSRARTASEPTSPEHGPGRSALLAKLRHISLLHERHCKGRRVTTPQLFKFGRGAQRNGGMQYGLTVWWRSRCVCFYCCSLDIRRCEGRHSHE